MLSVESSALELKDYQKAKMSIVKYEYLACRENSSNCFHFCAVRGNVIYPIGKCRESLRKIRPSWCPLFLWPIVRFFLLSLIKPCCHKTEKEAEDCYLAWQGKQFEAGNITENDLIFRSNEQKETGSADLGSYVEKD